MRLPEMQTNDISRARAGKPLHVRQNASEAEITKTAEEFESVFIGQMLQHMFSGIETNELFGGGEGEDVYRSFMIDEYAKIITRTGGIGVADHVKAEMLRLQEIGQQAPMRQPYKSQQDNRPATEPLELVEG